MPSSNVDDIVMKTRTCVITINFRNFKDTYEDDLEFSLSRRRL